MTEILINNFINKNGTFNYAFVVMVVNDDIYSNPAIIFSESLKKVGCLCDIIVMINNNISDECVNLLKKFFNKIIMVESIKIKNNNIVQQIILTKLNAFNLIEYKKIYLIDVDTILFSNIDKLLLNNNNNNTLYSISKENLGFIMINPSIDLYNKSLELIKIYKKEIEKNSKPFNFIMLKLFKNVELLNINISYNKYKNNIDNIKYINNKPFLMSSNLTIEKRINLDNFKVWFSFFLNVINKYEEIRYYKCLKECLDVSKYFL